jgi:hypothetical protein
MPQPKIKLSIHVLKYILRIVKEGIIGKFPPCCIIDFALTRFMGKPTETHYIEELNYRPCILCFKARKYTKAQSVLALFVAAEGDISAENFPLLPQWAQKIALS